MKQPRGLTYFQLAARSDPEVVATVAEVPVQPAPAGRRAGGLELDQIYRLTEACTGLEATWSNRGDVVEPAAGVKSFKGDHRECPTEGESHGREPHGADWGSRLLERSLDCLRLPRFDGSISGASASGPTIGPGQDGRVRSVADRVAGGRTAKRLVELEPMLATCRCTVVPHLFRIV